MIVLAIDTCFARCGVCLFNASANAVLAQDSQAMERGHAEALAPMVAGLLKQAHLESTEIERIAVTTGPGTFTGLRIGLSFARAFGLALKVPVIGLDTLRAVALAARDELSQVLILHQAGRSGFFYAFEPGHGPDIELLGQSDIDQRFLGKKLLVLGTGASALNFERVRHEPGLDLPSLERLARFAAQQPEPAIMPEPVYVRQADAKPQGAAMIAVRTATDGDAEMLAHLHQASFSPGWTKSDIVQMLQMNGTHALVGESDGQVSSFLMFRTIGDEAEILTLATAPMQRRNGHGGKLLAALGALAKTQGGATIYLEVAADNDAARALYKQFAFAEVGRRKGYYARLHGVAVDAILMKQVLQC